MDDHYDPARHRHLQHRQGWDLATILKGSRSSVRGSRAADRPCPQGRGQSDQGRARRGPQAVRDSPCSWPGSAAPSSTSRPTRPSSSKNIEGTKEYVRLAHDVGSPGVKVRPNGIPKGADLDATLRQIGRALHEVGDDADGFRRRDPRRGPRRRDPGPGQLRQDHQVRRPSQRLRLLELQPDRRRERHDQGDTSPWSPPRSTRSTSATSPTKPTPGASCSPC